MREETEWNGFVKEQLTGNKGERYIGFAGLQFKIYFKRTVTLQMWSFEIK